MFLIEKGLYQGGRPGLQPHNPKMDPSITALVNLEAQEDVPALYEPLTKTDCCQVLLPIHDADFPGLVWLRMAVDIVEALRNAGHTVYIHCRAGISRSVMLTAAVLMRRHGWDVDNTMNFIASANPKLNPNPRFMSGLKEWQREPRCSQK